ncbi:hypothetical protein L3Q82_018048 [Scortum barcoo]|uniref:Uncharacterized protein n=1 Tax=Scortum barcoo TaxID=214431 RepID=A0ACB8VI01_9TELE|nr:hypothetical protein L3Q82_018048 [Scortum barcoo]
MQDNARPHVAGVCQQFLQDEGIDAMDWPARSPDLNPIEHIWDIMSRSIHQRHVAPQTVQELADALVQVWEEIPQETIRHLIRSMPRLSPAFFFLCSLSLYFPQQLCFVWYPADKAADKEISLFIHVLPAGKCSLTSTDQTLNCF